MAGLLGETMIKAIQSNIWIVVADGARSRFFRASDDMKRLISVRKADMVSPDSRQRAHELKSDKPGRSYSASRSGTRHALEPPHDYQKLEKHRFMAALADALESACTRGEFDDLVLVLPRRSLGELRSLLSKKAQSRVRQEIAKDLTNETASDLFRAPVDQTVQMPAPAHLLMHIKAALSRPGDRFRLLSMRTILVLEIATQRTGAVSVRGSHDAVELGDLQSPT